MNITVRQLPSTYWHIRGCGPCNWAQPSTWPCDEAAIRGSAHPEASEAFIREATTLARLYRLAVKTDYRQDGVRD